MWCLERCPSPKVYIGTGNKNCSYWNQRNAPLSRSIFQGPNLFQTKYLYFFQFELSCMLWPWDKVKALKYNYCTKFNSYHVSKCQYPVKSKEVTREHTHLNQKHKEDTLTRYGHTQPTPIPLHTRACGCSINRQLLKRTKRNRALKTIYSKQWSSFPSCIPPNATRIWVRRAARDCISVYHDCQLSDVLTSCSCHNCPLALADCYLKDDFSEGTPRKNVSAC